MIVVNLQNRSTTPITDFAKWTARLRAGAIDFIFVSLSLICVYGVLFGDATLAWLAISPLNHVITLTTLLWLYRALLGSRWFGGQTLGAAATQVRTVDRSGEFPDLRDSFAREFQLCLLLALPALLASLGSMAVAISSALIFLAFLSTLFSSNPTHRAPHDWIGQTIVIRCSRPASIPTGGLPFVLAGLLLFIYYPVHFHLNQQERDSLFPSLDRFSYRALSSLPPVIPSADFPVDEEAFIGTLYERAQSNDIDALFDLAQILSLGTEQPALKKEYAYLIKKIHRFATRGNSAAASRLGALLYGAAENFPKAHKQGLYWLEEGAKEQDVFAQYLLGYALAYGANPSREKLSQASRWMLLAAKKGFAPAQTEIGYWFLKGLGFEKNREQATLWLRKAALQGDLEAAYFLSESQGPTPTYSQRGQLFFQANQGNAHAQYLVAKISLFSLPGFRKSSSVATTMLSKALLKGSQPARLMLTKLLKAAMKRRLSR